MIVCDFIDKNVEDFIKKDNTKRKILTFFKEPFNNYRGNKVIFIDDILGEFDYKKIDKFVNKTIRNIEEIFSQYLEVNDFKLFNYLKVKAKDDFYKTYKLKYGIDKIAKRKNIIKIYFFSSELELINCLKQDYLVKKMNKNNLRINIKFKKWLKNSSFIKIILNKIALKLYIDNQIKSRNILWIGGRSQDSYLISELEKENRMLLLQQLNAFVFIDFMKRKFKFNLL